ncbi:MAG: hypothetical protein WBR13_05660 [Allosphingosinicella sp.]
MAKDFRNNRRGCLVVAALAAAMIAALAYGIFWTGEDPRSNGIAPSGVQPAPAAGAASPGRSDPSDPEI